MRCTRCPPPPRRLPPVLLLPLLLLTSTIVGDGNGDAPAPAAPSCIRRLDASAAFTPSELASLVRDHADQPLLLANAAPNRRLRTRWSLEHLERVAGAQRVNVQLAGLLAGSGLQAQQQPRLREFTARLRGRLDGDDGGGGSDDGGSAPSELLFDRGAFFRSEGGRQLAAEYDATAWGGLALEPGGSWGDAQEAEADGGSSLVLSLGGGGAGIPFHYHAASVLELLAGTKQWCGPERDWLHHHLHTLASRCPLPARCVAVETQHVIVLPAAAAC